MLNDGLCGGPRDLWSLEELFVPASEQNKF